MRYQTTIILIVKRFYTSSIFVTSIALVSCGDFDQTLSGDFDPLMHPGSQQVSAVNIAGNYNFSAGEYVTAASNSTAFFTNKPTGNAEATELLAAGTSMRVIKTEGSFVKVELDNGKVGYVAAALLLEGRQGTGETQGYPLPGGEIPLPLPTGSMPDNLSPGLAPTDLDTTTPLPPIAPPNVGELPPSSLEEKKPDEGTLPPPANGGQ